MVFVCCEALAEYAKKYFKDSNVKVIVLKHYAVESSVNALVSERRKKDDYRRKNSFI